MLIRDKVYGKEEITDPVLIELIKSKTFQRLKGITQQGMPENYYGRTVYSRYEHSLGVMILLKRLGAELDEQIAGLLHDISHTAFSHVIDQVLGDPLKEDYQDSNHLRVIKNSEIPKLLEDFGIDYREIAQPELFSLLDKHAPSLCTDRIDYTLREFENLGKDTLVKLCVTNLENCDGLIVFKTQKSAESFAFGYMDLEQKYWSGNEAKARYYLLAKALRRALYTELISKDDLMKTDDFIMQILEKSGDREILETLRMLKNGFRVEESDEGLELKSKFRFVDPEVLTEEGVVKLTSLSLLYKNALDKEKIRRSSYVKIKIIK